MELRIFGVTIDLGGTGFSPIFFSDVTFTASAIEVEGAPRDPPDCQAHTAAGTLFLTGGGLTQRGANVMGEPGDSDSDEESVEADELGVQIYDGRVDRGQKGTECPLCGHRRLRANTI